MKRKMLWLNLLSLVVFPVWVIVFALAFHLTDFVLHTWTACILIVATLVIHEALHTASIKFLAPQVQVSYGVKKPLALYVRIEGEMTTEERLAFLLTPFVQLSLVFGAIAWAAPDMALTMTLLAAVNASGSINDLVRSFEILQETAQKRKVATQ